MSNVLDAVLAQYEKNQQGGGAQSKMSQDERMKKFNIVGKFGDITGRPSEQALKEIEKS